MKKYYFLIIVALILGLILTGCSLLSNIGQAPATDQSGITYLTKGGPTENEADEYTLYAGQNIPVGTVNVWNDSEILYVQYVVDDPWEMTGSHLYVGKTDPIDFPSTPGQLPYSPGMEKSPSPSASYDDATMTYIISLDEIYDYEFVGKGQGKGLNAVGVPGVEPCVEIYIAAHAEVQREYFEPVWQIGDVEENNLVNPYDEFNYPTQVTGTQDFYVDTTLTTNFPYFSDPPGYAPIINIYFNAEMLLGGRFMFSWSPGNSGTEIIEVSLGGTKLGEVTRIGTSTSGWWKSQERFIDSFDIPATEAGDHILTINVTAGNGLVWDWLRLEEQCIQEESAWAVVDDDVLNFGKNWATYFNYNIAGLPPTISSLDLAGPFIEDEFGYFIVTTVNPLCGFAYEHVLFNYTIFGIAPSNIVSFKYYDEGTATWYNAPVIQDGSNVIGFFGPPTGFPMGVPYNESTTFEIKIDTMGTYPVTITLNDLDDGNAELAILTQDVVVFPETVLAVGDSYGGGIVAYILQSGDDGYDANEQHGLIAATTDQSTAGIQWYNGSYVVTGAIATAIGTGQANTTTIVTAQGAGSYAAQLCYDLTEGGYDDWFLPSKDELDKLYSNEVAIGNFAFVYYWSSSENNASLAWAQYFATGFQNSNGGKSTPVRVRAVRAF